MNRFRVTILMVLTFGEFLFLTCRVRVGREGAADDDDDDEWGSSCTFLIFSVYIMCPPWGCIAIYEISFPRSKIPGSEIE
jgi:hypothetical protein